MRNLPKIEKGKKKERQRKESGGGGGGGGGGGQQRSDSDASSSVSGEQDIAETASRKSASSGIKDLDPVVEEETDN